MNDLETFDPKDLHRQIMNKVWSLYCQSAANEDWIDMPAHISEIHDEIDSLVAHALGLKAPAAD